LFHFAVPAILYVELIYDDWKQHEGSRCHVVFSLGGADFYMCRS
jgi:hypothetical protein